MCLILSYTLLNATPIIFKPAQLGSNDIGTDIRRIDQLRDGTIWISANDGLFIYDGQTIKPIKFNNGERPLIVNDFTGVTQTKTGEIWVSSGSGITYISAQIEEAITLDYRTNGLLPQVWGLEYFSNESLLLVGGYGQMIYSYSDIDGIRKFDFPDVSYNIENPPYSSPITFEPINNNNILIGFADGGLGTLDLESQSFVHLKVLSSKFASVFDIHRIDPSHFYLATNTGLWIYNAKESSVEIVDELHHEIRTILPHPQYGLLLAGKGLFAKSVHQKATRIDRFNGFDTKDILITAIQLDREGTIWMGVKGQGIFRHLPSANKVSFTASNDFFDKRTADPVLQTEVKNDRRYVLLPNQFAQIAGSGELIRAYLNDSDAKFSRFTVDDERVLIADTRHIHVLDHQLKLVKKISINWPKGLNINSISALHINADNVVWISGNSFDESRLMYAEFNKSPVFQLYDSNDPLFINRADQNYIVQLDHRTKFLSINSGDFYRVFDTQNKRVIYDERKQPKHERHISSKYNLFKHGETVYKAADSGMFYHTYWDAANHSLAPFTKLQTPVNNAHCLIETAPGEYWLAQKNGSLFFWNSHTDELLEYDEADGSSAAGLTGKSCVENPETGKLYFAANDGLVIVDPSNIPTNTVQPNVYIEDIIAGEESFSSVDAVDGRDGVKIDYDQSIEFSLRVDSYAVPSENRLKTRLRGINDWVERSSEQNEVKFSQLASGSYVFDVMGSNNDGVWSESKALRFTILPPWWRSTLAYLTYAVAMLALMVMFFRHRTKQLQQRAKALQAEVELRTQELAQEKQMVESLLEQKNNEFANVSHEFRTPLTLILGPVNKLLEQTKKWKTKKSYQWYSATPKGSCAWLIRFCT